MKGICSNKVKILFVLVIVVLLSICGYFMIRNFFNDSVSEENLDTIENNEINNSDDSEMDNNNIEDIPDGDLDLNSNMVQDLYLKINPSDDVNVLKDLYESNSLTNSYLLAAGAMNYIRDNISLDSPEVQNGMLSVDISEEDMAINIQEIFGNVEYQNDNFYVFNSEYGVCGFTYQPDEKRYVSLNGCGGNGIDSFKRKIVSAEKKEDIIYITERLIYIYNDVNNETTYVYDNYKRNELLAQFEMNETNYLDISLNDYLDGASTYIYEFKKINEKYVFNKIYLSKE